MKARFTVDAYTSFQFGFLYCKQVNVTNTGHATGHWHVNLPVEGYVTSLRGAYGRQMRGQLYAAGLMYNRFLAPGAKTQFSYCGFNF